MDDSQRGTMHRLSDWAMHPFRSDMSALDWFLFLGLVSIAAFFWSQIMKAVEAA